MTTAVIIGGGITGLTALYELTKQAPDWNVILLEQQAQIGGKIRTVHSGGFTIETGADSIVARNEGVLPLIEELGLQEKMVYNETGVSYIYTNNQLHKIPEQSLFGIPGSLAALEESTLVSEAGKQAALQDLAKTDMPFGPDDSAGDFLTYYFGKELVDKQIAPVLSGVYSGSLDTLLLKSTLPFLLEYKKQYGSIIKGLEANQATLFGDKARKKFVSFQGGLGTLTNRLAEAAKPARIATGTQVTGLSQSGKRWNVQLGGESITADYVVMAVPHSAAQAIFRDPVLDESFNQLQSASLISVYLGFDVPDALLPADGTGFIVSENSDIACDACTWTSRKWAHTSGEGRLLVRLFYKSASPLYEKLAALGDEALVAAARKDVQKSLGISSKPVSADITRWQNQMPSYHLEHSKAVDALTRKLGERYPNVFLAGCSYFGVGIGACMQNGKKVAFNLLKSGNSLTKE